MMTATLCPSTDQIRSLSLGQLPEAQSDQIFDHIRDCEICRSQLETVEDTQDSLIASIRAPDEQFDFSNEPDCQVAVVRALGALALASKSSAAQEMGQMPEVNRRIRAAELARPWGNGGVSSWHVTQNSVGKWRSKCSQATVWPILECGNASSKRCGPLVG